MNKRKQRTRFLRRGTAFCAAVGVTALLAAAPWDWGQIGCAAALLAVSVRQPAGTLTVLGQQNAPVFRNGALTVDYDAGCAYMDGVQLRLTPTEYKLLCLLSREVGKVLTHTSLTDKLWGSCWDSDMAALRVHMATLRKKLEKDSEVSYIQTHVGIGYRMLKLDT